MPYNLNYTQICEYVNRMFHIFANIFEVISMGVVDRIRTLCEEKGITINKLEKEVEIGRGNIARWDKHKPNILNVQKVADYFSVTTDYILTGNENKPTPEGEPMSLEALRSLSKEELYELMNNVVKALKEKE